MTKLEYVLKPVAELTANPRNARTHSKDQIKKIAASIKEFGFIAPAIIDKDGVLVAGHGRLEAAKKLKMAEIPCVIADHLTPEQLRAYMLADNRIQLDGGWDEEILKIELSELAALDFDLSFTGFDVSEVSSYVRRAEVDEKEDEAPEPPPIPKSKLGDIWLLGNHRLMCGDSTSKEQVEILMDGKKADMIFTDPPYGIDIVQGKSSTVGGAAPTKFSGTDGAGSIVPAKTYLKIKGDETTDVARKFYETCVEIGFNKIVLWGGNYFTDFLNPSRCWLIWDKEMTGNFSQAEMAWTNFEKGGVKVFKFLWNGLSRAGNRDDELKGRVHPTQKPVGLFENIFSRIDDFKSVFDGFGGSGSTLITCEKTNRQCYMMELEPHYVDVIIKRWQDYTGQEAVHAETGKTYNEA